MCYTIIGEMSSTRLRQKSIALSRIAYQIMNIICGIIVPRMLSPTSWNWGPKSGLFWGGVSGLTAIYLVLRLPETKGRSYGELDLLFERRVPAWRFKSTKVDRKSTDDERNSADVAQNLAMLPTSIWVTIRKQWEGSRSRTSTRDRTICQRRRMRMAFLRSFHNTVSALGWSHRCKSGFPSFLATGSAKRSTLDEKAVS